MSVNRIGVYAGSFNPFHVRHLDIVVQASKIFDSVIIAQGLNPTKPRPVPLSVSNMPRNCVCIHFDGMLHKYVESLESPDTCVTLIRGIRSGLDLDAENNQRRIMLDLKPDLKYVYLPCQAELAHVSSSAIRTLLALGQDVSQYLASQGKDAYSG